MKFVSMFVVVLALSVALGCGGGEPWCTSNLIGIQMTSSPSPATADHNAAPPANQVTFQALPRYGDPVQPCRVHPNPTGIPPTPLPSITWTVSDPGSVSLSNTGNNAVVATCMSTTPTPVTVTASATNPGGGATLTGTATLTCL